MKTKSLLLTALMTVSSLLAVANDDPKDTGLMVINGKEGIYKLIYEGEKSSTLKLSIVNEKGKVVYEERVGNLKGFIVPVNFKGMAAGQYTIQLSGNSQILKTTVNYSPVVKG